MNLFGIVRKVVWNCSEQLLKLFGIGLSYSIRSSATPQEPIRRSRGGLLELPKSSAAPQELPPGVPQVFLQTSSRPPPELLQTSSRAAPEFLQISSRAPPDLLQTSSRAPPDLLQSSPALLQRSSRDPPGLFAPNCKTFVKIGLASTAPELLQSSSRPPPDLLQTSSRALQHSSSAPPALLQSSSRTVLLQSAKHSSKSSFGAPECETFVKIRLWSSRMRNIR